MLEDRRLLTADVTIDVSNALNYLGSAVNNNLTVSESGGTYTFNDSAETIQVTNSGTATYTLSDGDHTLTVSGIVSIGIDTGDGDDTVNIRSIDVATTVDTSTGSGDVINVGSLAPTLGGTLAGIQASLSLADSGSDGNTTTIDDSGNTSAATFALNSGSVSGLTASPILINGDVSTLNVYGGSGGNTISVEGVTVQASLDLFSGAGNDNVTVLSTPSPLVIDGNGGSDTVTVGDSGSVAGITSQVAVNNSVSGGTTDLTVDASADTSASGDPVSISGTEIDNLAPAAIVYDANLGSLTIQGPNNAEGSEPTNYDITNTPTAGTTLDTGNNGGTITVEATTGALTINNEGGYSIVMGIDGDTSGIVGAVTVNGHTPTITVDDSADTIGQTFNIAGDGSLAHFTASPNQDLNFDYDPTRVGQIVVLAGLGDDTLTVDFTAGNPLPLGLDSDINPNSPADDLDFDGGNGSNTLILLGDPTAADNFAFDSETYYATGPGAGNIGLGYTDLVLGPITQTIGFTNLAPVEDSAVATDYSINVVNPASHEIGLTDTTVAPGATPAVLIADSTGAASFESAAVANKTNVTINTSPGNAVGWVAENDFTINNPTAPAGLTTLTVNGGPTDDQFHVVATSSGVVTNLNGGDGNDVFYVDGANLGADGTLNANGGPSFDTLNVTSTDASPVITPTPSTNGNGAISNIGSTGTFNYTSIETINLTKPAAAVTNVTVLSVTATEAKAFTNQVVATFSNPTVPAGAVGDLNLSAKSYVASIDWGDGSTSAGWIVANGTGGYDVLGSHTYLASGTRLITVTITSAGSNGSETIAGSTTTLNVTSTGDVASVPATATANAAVAAAPLYAQAAQISGFEGIALNSLAAGVIVATFADSGTIGLATAYTAAIDWGDGTSSTSTQILATGTPNGTVFSVYGNHTYSTVGTYPVTVTITKTASGAQATAVSTATIADAPLLNVVPPPTIVATAGVYYNGPVNSFIDTNPTILTLAEASRQFNVLIDWGDGSPQSSGYLSAVATTAGGQRYTISGQHTYASSLFTGVPGFGVPGPVNSTFPITIHVQDNDGAAINLANLINVIGVRVVVSGHLDPASDSGVSHTDGITNVNQPTFIGAANQPNVRISVYETPAGGGSPVLIGTTTSDTTGAWALTSNIALADGSYTITAVGVDSANQILSETATLTPNPITIDTVGPKVTGLFFARVNGQIQVTYQDYGGANNAGVGLNFATVVDANNYRLTKAHQRRGYLLSAVSISPGTTSGAQTATLFINGGKYLRGGHYVFTIISAGGTNPTGLQDIAGNALDGEYYGYLPSGNNVRGGNLVATLNAKHTVIYAPGSVIGSSTPVSPPGTRPGNVIINRVSPPKSSHTKFIGQRTVHRTSPTKLHHQSTGHHSAQPKAPSEHKSAKHHSPKPKTSSEHKSAKHHSPKPKAPAVNNSLMRWLGFGRSL